MIRLIIENNELELNETVQVAITKQFEDLSNPTTIINDWSKTVSIPFTVKNNNIFGHIYNIDKLTVASNGTQSLTGIYFNPYKKLNMRLQWGDNVLMVGYAKMNEVKQNNGKGTYELTLFGELGKLFQEMKKITFDTTTDDTNYLIDGSKYVEEYINKDLVAASWKSEGQTQSNLQKKWIYSIKPQTGEVVKQPNPSYRVTDIIGFAPNNSFSNDFEYNSFQNTNDGSTTFTDLYGDSFKQATGVELDTVIPNGLIPREVGEYRSYQQLPFIYWNKLFQIFQAKSEEITGYKFELDESWFNTSNPYWYNLVYMLYGFSNRTKEEIRKKNNYQAIVNGLSWGKTPTSEIKTEAIQIRNDYSNESYPILIQEGSNISTKIRMSNDYNVLLNNQIVFRMQIPALYKSSTRYNIHLNPNNAFEFSIICIDKNGNAVKKRKYLLCDENYSGSTDDYFRVLRMSGGDRDAKHLNGSYDVYDLYVDINQVLNLKDFGEYASLSYSGKWLNTNYPFKDTNNDDYIPTQTTYSQTFTIDTSYLLYVEVVINPRRTDAYFTLNTLWNNEYNIFTEILKYCKMYRIGISVDVFSKKIIFKPFTKYFTEYTVSDLTDKIDKSKDYTIKPITFENKYVLFNYEDSNTKLNEEYKNNNGINYGEYRLRTEYNFNTSTLNLFDKVKGGIVNTDYYLTRINLFENKTITYSLPPEIYVYCQDKDRKFTDVFGQFYFFCGLSNFSTEKLLYMPRVFISDDTDTQTAKNTFFYSVSFNELNCTSYPKLDILLDNNLCLFNIPSTNYTYLNNYSNKNSIYTNFWEKYLNERYNVQNKLITCYVTLKPTEFNQFKWNQFVKIGNQLCIVNKIYDYDATANVPTKVDLITIQNIDGYTSDNYNN